MIDTARLEDRSLLESKGLNQLQGEAVLTGTATINSLQGTRIGYQKGGNLMSKAEAMANLSELSTLSKTLNEESNRVNELLSDVEKRLLEMNLGVEAWVVIKEERYTEGQDEDTSNWIAETQIGLANWHGQPKLMVRRVHSQQTSEYGESSYEERTQDSYQPLLQASRAIRLKAMASLEELLDAILEEAKQVLAGINKGKQAYKKLASE